MSGDGWFITEDRLAVQWSQVALLRVQKQWGPGPVGLPGWLPPRDGWSVVAVLSAGHEARLVTFESEDEARAWVAERPWQGIGCAECADALTRA